MSDVQSSDAMAHVPKYLSSDHDPLYRFHQWQANLRVLGVTEVKTVPYVPLSHPFVERLIGTIRREFLGHVLFWTAADLESKLFAFQTYFNSYRTHASLKGQTPIERRNPETSAWNLIAGRNTVAVCIKRQRRREYEFASHTSRHDQCVSAADWETVCDGGSQIIDGNDFRRCQPFAKRTVHGCGL